MANGLGPFYDLEHAAEYCGYSASYFAKIIRSKNIKRYGPSQSRFARADLDRFMAAPDSYSSTSGTKSRTPIELEV
jgi:hypothetical protein